MTEIRVAREGDGAGVAAIYDPIVRDTAISFEVDPPGAAEMRRRIGVTLETHPWLVCADGESVRGYAYASRHRERAAYRWSVDVTVYVHEQARRRGVGRALYTALLTLLVRQGYRQAYGGITLPNAGSVGLHESQGFRRIGVYEDVGWKLGAWHAVGWWGRELAPATAVPSEPLPFAKLRHDPALAEALARGSARLARP
jgi:phosphinothricin acetyltransferase